MFKINIDACEMEIVNLTDQPVPPYFQMMRSDISKDQLDYARQLWIKTLPEDLQELIEREKMFFDGNKK